MCDKIQVGNAVSVVTYQILDVNSYAGEKERRDSLTASL